MASGQLLFCSLMRISCMVTVVLACIVSVSLHCLYFIFTEEEISAMKQELDKYGIHMPHFGKIGGILAKEVCMFT